jgi:uncharacterized protein YqjF (DUF2071 family)
MIPRDRHPDTPPDGPWIMVQRWHDLLFAHWRCSASDLRPLIPRALEIETFDGSAWIGVVPFYMSGVRMRMAPPIPTATDFPELNVRTYVELDGRPGVWFFSLDCASILATIGARLGISLPYFRATMEMTRHDDGRIFYNSQRWPIAGAPAHFEARYRGHGPAATAPPGSLPHFLTERYCLYSASDERIWRADIYHPRWSLHSADAQFDVNTMIDAIGVRPSDTECVLHFAKFQDVHVWMPVRVR